MQKTLGLIAIVIALLCAATVVVRLLQRRTDGSIDPAILDKFRRRVHAWWIFCTVVAVSLLFQSAVTVFVFGMMAFWALREFITLTPTRPGDHRTLFWVFFLCTPLQFIFVGLGWYGIFSVFIPVYALLLVPARIAIADDCKRFLERVAKIQAGLLICVYALSYAPAVLTSLPESHIRGEASARLLFFLIVITQLSDGLHYAWSQMASRHVIAPSVSPSRTWEGLVGGTLSAMLVGAALWWATPFSPWQTGMLAVVISVMGFAGNMTMSAVKRDRGVRDYGTLVEGHGGILDRIDSLCFASPVFYHLVWYIATGVDLPG